MIVGIDLGTTHSLVGVFGDAGPRLIPNALGDLLTPSVVSVDDDGALLVGRAAAERLVTHPDRTVAGFKRWMGSDRPTPLGKHVFRPEELSALVLRSLVADAEAHLGGKVDEAVISVPAYFGDAQRKATRSAGELAGIKVERLINEPTAAALAYGLDRRDDGGRFLVFDLGGGTFDVSILEMFDGVMEVHASAGDNFLGGEDFVTALVDAFYTRSGLNKALGSRTLDGGQRQRLVDEAERAKRALSAAPTVRMAFTFEGTQYGWDLDEDTFAALAEPLLQRLRTPVERALRDATIKAQELDTVVLAGGATRMPLVRKLAARMFGRFPSVHLDPDHAIALGAAVQAGLKMRDAALDEVVMTDVAPYSLGIEISRQVGPNDYDPGHYLPIIERNSAVPVSRVENITTVRDGQKELNVRIYQGEARRVADNVYLGVINFPIPAKKAGEVSADVRFTYDISGVLEAEITVKPTEEKHKLVITENAGVMTADEIDKRFAELAELKIHPRDQIENRTLIAQADRLYEQLLGDARQYLGHHITMFQAVLERQDPQETRRAREQLAQVLGQLDGGPYL